LWPEGEFEGHWRAQGEQQGEEHHVYSTADGKTVIKRNNLKYHASFLEYFERVALHNHLFPQSRLHFLGFDESDWMLKPVTSQWFIEARRGATELEIEEHITKLGFSCSDDKGLNWYSRETGIVVEDLHDQNAVSDEQGRLVVFDPVIYAKPTERLIRATLRPRGLI